MKDEFSDRHQAIKLRLAGHSVEYICQTLGRSREWFHTWWRRYQAMGHRRALRPDAGQSPTAGLFNLNSSSCSRDHVLKR